MGKRVSGKHGFTAPQRQMSDQTPERPVAECKCTKPGSGHEELFRSRRQLEEDVEKYHGWSRSLLEDATCWYRNSYAREDYERIHYEVYHEEPDDKFNPTNYRPEDWNDHEGLREFYINEGSTYFTFYGKELEWLFYEATRSGYALAEYPETLHFWICECGHRYPARSTK